MRMTVYAAATLAMLAAPAMAAPEWVRVGAHGDSGSIEVDSQSIAVANGLRRATWRVHHAAPRRDGSVTEENRELIDCRDGMTATLGVTLLAADASVISRTFESESAALRRLSPATPGTSGAMVAQAICRMPIPQSRNAAAIKRHH